MPIVIPIACEFGVGNDEFGLVADREIDGVGDKALAMRGRMQSPGPVRRAFGRDHHTGPQAYADETPAAAFGFDHGSFRPVGVA